MAEGYSNAPKTTLSGAITSAATSLTLASGTGFPTSNFRMKVEDEIILGGTRSGTSVTGCTRGAEGTTAASHVSGSAVRHVLSAAALANIIAEGATGIHATTVSGLGTGAEGRRGILRIGSSPYHFIPVFYDGTAAKWVEPSQHDVGVRLSDNTFPVIQTANTSYTTLTSAETQRGFIPYAKECFDAGLRLYVDYTALISNNTAAKTTDFRLVFREFADGDTGGNDVWHSNAVSLTSTTATIKHSGWHAVNLTSSLTDANGGMYVQMQMQTTSGGTANAGAVGARYRWVSS